MKISVLNAFSSKELSELQGFWNTHKDDDDSENEPNINFFDIPRKVIYAKEKDLLVGMIFLYYRDIFFENTKIRLSGLGGVVTHKDFRRKGIAKRMLNKAHHVMKNDNIDISMLCTDINKLGKLYASIGFKPLKRNYFFTDKNGNEKEESGGMIAPIKSTKIVDHIISSHNKLHVGLSNF